MRKTSYRKKSVERNHDRKIMKIITNKNQFQQAANSIQKDYISLNRRKQLPNKNFSITFYGTSRNINKQLEKPMSQSMLKQSKKQQTHSISLQQSQAINFSQSLDRLGRFNRNFRTTERLVSKTVKNDANFDIPLLISTSQISDFNSSMCRPSKFRDNIRLIQPRKQSPKEIDRCQIELQLNYMKMLRDRQLKLRKRKQQSNFERSLILNNHQKGTIKSIMNVNMIDSSYPQLPVFQHPKLQRKRNREQNTQQFSPWKVAEESQLGIYQF